ncbi:MAG: hypothetical protein H7Y88_07875 [Phycisphaerales bacterium]|nr:hypothetical protein [Phycisphaerales bacterium]
MKITTPVLAAAVSGLGLATLAVATPPLITLDWKVNGQESVNVTPGQTVIVTGTAMWGADSLLSGLASMLLTVEMPGSDLTDALDFASPGLGRNSALSMMPQLLVDIPMPGMRTISANTGAIDLFQLPAFINPGFDASNPIEVFRYTFTAGGANRMVPVDSPVFASQLYDAVGMAGPVPTFVDGAIINIVPSPGSLALLGLSGTMLARRRRA